MKFRTKYERNRIVSPHGGKSLTEQQFASECDLSAIIQKYGIIPPPSVTPLTGADVSNFGDYADCLQAVVEATEQFEAMPSSIRERFGYDPQSFFKWVADPRNVDEGVRLGIFTPRGDTRSAEQVLKDIEKIVTPAKTDAGKTEA